MIVLRLHLQRRTASTLLLPRRRRRPPPVRPVVACRSPAPPSHQLGSWQISWPKLSRTRGHPFCSRRVQIARWSLNRGHVVFSGYILFLRLCTRASPLGGRTRIPIVFVCPLLPCRRGRRRVCQDLRQVPPLLRISVHGTQCYSWVRPLCLFFGQRCCPAPLDHCGFVQRATVVVVQSGVQSCIRFSTCKHAH